MGGAKTINKLFSNSVAFPFNRKPNELSLQKLYSVRESDTFCPTLYIHIYIVIFTANIYQSKIDVKENAKILFTYFSLVV